MTLLAAYDLQHGWQQLGRAAFLILLVGRELLDKLLLLLRGLQLTLFAMSQLEWFHMHYDITLAGILP